ncbi:UBP-type zinc finger domain-containing protein [Mucilaginibacter sp. KACC 22063]|uniref:UBP-type zinc finger domain-containing protein n=1 Tax=Mucilaginibacter sp. KACC 22063 TaxID=3025666 RepID=UPI00236591D7|nr:UBP-type zinc finger domain-containing protein [Mucilaginibacter sp. KACC 22063]WDF55642.1 UBP-type zinc finger domain-containing protein [Mucilaginibacter sp. KACC 22063]
MDQSVCKHLQEFKEIPADKYYCEECVKTGGNWLHLRVCQTCGVVLCCDSSPNRHASKHAAQKHHPVITSAEPGERWAYCFIDDIGIELE